MPSVRWIQLIFSYDLVGKLHAQTGLGGRRDATIPPFERRNQQVVTQGIVILRMLDVDARGLRQAKVQIGHQGNCPAPTVQGDLHVLGLSQGGHSPGVGEPAAES
jgi:hypothetical protein